MRHPLWLQSFSAWITARPGRTLAALLAAGALFGLFAARLSLETSYVALLPKDAPELQRRLRLAQELAGTTELILSLSGPPEARLAVAREVVARLRESPAVLAAELELPTTFLEQRWLYLIPLDGLERLEVSLRKHIREAKARANPLFVDLSDQPPRGWEALEDEVRALRAEARTRHGWEPEPQGAQGDASEDAPRFLTSPDGASLFVAIQPRAEVGELGESRRVIAEIEQVIASAHPSARGVEWRLAGRLMVTLEEHQVLSRDMTLSTLLSLALVICLMVAATRRGSAILIMGAPLALGLAATLAVTAVSLGRLNLVSGFMIPVLAGLGVDFCIHLHLRFGEEREAGLPPAEAMRAAIQALFLPCLGSALTTSAAFLALCVSDFKGASEYGLVASYGVLLMMLAAFLAVPPLALLLDRGATVRAPPPRPWWSRARRWHGVVIGRAGGAGVRGEPMVGARRPL